MKAFNFDIVSVDPESRVMEVSYTADGYEPILVGVRLPVLDENLDTLLRSFAPNGQWDQIDFLQKPVVVPEVGMKGRVELPAPVALRVQQLRSTPIES